MNNGDRNSYVYKQMWSFICCCNNINSNINSNKSQARSQTGSYLKGRVHPVTRIEKWEEKITEAKSNGKIVSSSSYDLLLLSAFLL